MIFFIKFYLTLSQILNYRGSFSWNRGLRKIKLKQLFHILVCYFMQAWSLYSSWRVGWGFQLAWLKVGDWGTLKNNEGGEEHELVARYHLISSP